jgi:hypothetical protein
MSHARRFTFVPVLLLALAGCAHSGATQRASDDHDAAFVPIFNGKDLTGWTYGIRDDGSLNKVGQGYRVENGVIYCTPTDGGNLFTKAEYANFTLHFEFKLTENANNGIGIRAPLQGNAAYDGMEIQVLDDSGSEYTKLRPAQYHGSIYDVVPSERGHQKPVGEWNVEEITAKGRQITVTLNGATILSANLDDIKDPLVLKKHPGLQNSQGHIGFLGHGARVDFRNLKVKAL